MPNRRLEILELKPLRGVGSLAVFFSFFRPPAASSVQSAPPLLEKDSPANPTVSARAATLQCTAAGPAYVSGNGALASNRHSDASGGRWQCSQVVP